jgi:predicted amidohydrolase YtcJ
VLVDRDIARVERATIDDARVMLTIVGGRILFDRDGVLR